MRIAISRVHFPITTLGPGKRLGIWVQGCSIRCPGCISTDTWAITAPTLSIDDFVAQIYLWVSTCEGITISGGEPFDQAPALVELVKVLKRHTAVDILVFSGHPLEKISVDLERAAPCIDAVMSDPYSAAQPQTLALRGSDNQRLTFLTDLGRERFATYDRMRTAADDKLDLMMDAAGSAWMVGIPKPGDLTRLKALLADQGDTCRTSEAPVAIVGGSP